MIRDVVLKTRTIRRFQEHISINEDILMGFVDLARFGGSARNSQPLRYMIVTDKDMRDTVFKHLGWAGYFTEWPGPDVGERPAAYLICLLKRDRLIGPENEAHFDLGISTQNILLEAAEKGIYGCRIGSFTKTLGSELGIDNGHKILLVLALGYPAEKVVVEDVGKNGNICYWRDPASVHHVPKRTLLDLLYTPL